jgi:hypothetical protein
MPLFKRRTAWRAFAVVLPFALCVTIGMVLGIHGGLHNEAAMQYRFTDVSAMNRIHEAIRLYGASVFLTVLSASALTTVALFVSRMFPASHKKALHSLRKRSNQALERTAARRVNSFLMT